MQNGEITIRFMKNGVRRGDELIKYDYLTPSEVCIVCHNNIIKVRSDDKKILYDLYVLLHRACAYRINLDLSEMDCTVISWKDTFLKETDYSVDVKSKDTLDTLKKRVRAVDEYYTYISEAIDTMLGSNGRFRYKLIELASEKDREVHKEKLITKDDCKKYIKSKLESIETLKMALNVYSEFKMCSKRNRIIDFAKAKRTGVNFIDAKGNELTDLTWFGIVENQINNMFHSGSENNIKIQYGDIEGTVEYCIYTNKFRGKVVRNGGLAGTYEAPTLAELAKMFICLVEKDKELM